MRGRPDRKSTRLNSSHLVISYAVFCLKKKFAEEDSDRAHQTGHSTARQAARVAPDAQVRLLARTHISSRYPGGDLRVFFFFMDAATTEIYPFSLNEVLPI